MIRTVHLDNPYDLLPNPRKQVERKPQSRQVQARRGMLPERELAQFDTEQAAREAYVGGQHARLDARMARAISTLETLVPQVRAAVSRLPKKFHYGHVHGMIYDNDTLHDAAHLTWYDTRLIADYLLAAAAGDTKTVADLRPHVVGLFMEARQGEQQHVTERYPSLKHHPHLLNPKEHFRSRRASKRAARGAAATQADLDTHYEQVSHDIAEKRQDKMLSDMYRREARLIADTPERDY
jgi:hypothetical protein